jgi:peptidoglycan hydrolase-like protein with peptidoglycan-binding domain
MGIEGVDHSSGYAGPGAQLAAHGVVGDRTPAALRHAQGMLGVRVDGISDPAAKSALTRRGRPS